MERELCFCLTREHGKCSCKAFGRTSREERSEFGINLRGREVCRNTNDPCIGLAACKRLKMFRIVADKDTLAGNCKIIDVRIRKSTTLEVFPHMFHIKETIQAWKHVREDFQRGGLSDPHVYDLA